MENLFGIEPRDECRAKTNELLEMYHDAQRAMNKDTVMALNDRLTEYYKLGDAIERRKRMSDIEMKYFSRAIDDAYVAAQAINLNSPKTWQNGLSKIESELLHWKHALPK